MGGYREGDMPRMGLSVPFAYHLALRCKTVVEKKRKKKYNMLIIANGTSTGEEKIYI